MKFLMICTKAKFHFPDLWDNHDNLRAHLNRFGHKKHYVTTVIAYVQSLSDLFQMFRMSLIKSTQLIRSEMHKEVELPLDLSQNAIKTHINKAVCLRQQHYFE